MRGKAVVDGVMSAVGAAFLLSVPIRDAIRTDVWVMIVLAGAALGVLATKLARTPSGPGAWWAFALLLGPAAALAPAGAAYAFTYLVAHGLGIVAGRRRFPAA